MAGDGLYPYALTTTVEPDGEPMTADEMRDHIRVSYTLEDPKIESFIAAARRVFEVRTDRQVLTATLAMRMDRFPPAICGRPSTIRLPAAPLQSVSSVAYNDSAGDAQTLVADTDYTVDTFSEPGRIVPAKGKVWPGTYGHIHDVTVTFVAGYGVAADVPKGAILAIQFLVAHWFEQREPTAEMAILRVPDTFGMLIESFRVIREF